MNINNIEQLRNLIVCDEKFEYLFFWSHKHKHDEITKACLSQWYESQFEIEDTVYQTAEQYMMAQKAKLFNDRKCLTKILKSQNPAEAKKLGRTIKAFQEDVWLKHRMSIVVKGNLAKFSQNQQLKNFLVNTSNQILVEASPVDRIWGVGLAEDNSLINNVWQWKGLNLLGFALMEVRAKLQ